MNNEEVRKQIHVKSTHLLIQWCEKFTSYRYVDDGVSLAAILQHLMTNMHTCRGLGPP